MGAPWRAVAAGADLAYDVVVVGAGVAGLVAALDVLDASPGCSVAVVDKGEIGSSGSTPLAQGGMAAAVGPGDSPILHAADTIRAADGLSDPRAVAVLTAEGPARVDDLVARGAVFDRTPSGQLDLAREGGQSVPRSVRAADATGAEIFRALRVGATGRVTRLQGIACGLAEGPGPSRGACGVWALLDEVDASPSGPAQEPGLVLIRGRAVVLATGGCGGLYAATTNRDGATADGVALAYAVGAALVDLEFVQFHPTGLTVAADGHRRLLLTEALRGAGAVLVDAEGRRFMVDRHPDAELAPRHVVTKGILDQPAGAWLDATMLGPDVLASEFPTVLAGVRRHGFDLASEPVPVEPCQHYMIGGVATDLAGRTSVAGLWAAGEVASTGVHGANRMAGNSLLQSCVFGHRSARAVAASLVTAEPAGGDPPPPVFAGAPVAADLGTLRTEVRVAMSAGAGPIRSGATLATADKALDAASARLGPAPAAARDAVEVAHLLVTGRLILRSARLRTESRGVHWREDCPGSARDWSSVRLRVQRPRLTQEP
ncbi:MAG: FAD-dependent oxidoreductase [Euzebyaceae bacterium]|nr:FAD-dependent oxidoreductase [Euzebyaceae bacterium]